MNIPGAEGLAKAVSKFGEVTRVAGAKIGERVAETGKAIGTRVSAAPRASTAINVRGLDTARKMATVAAAPRVTESAGALVRLPERPSSPGGSARPKSGIYFRRPGGG